MTTTATEPLAGPELDYAFLAEFARVEPGGTLTAVGASFTRLETPGLAQASWLYVAGRVRAPEGHAPVNVTMTFSGPEQGPQLRGGMDLDMTAGAPYRGRVGVLFTIGVTVPLVSVGLHTVDLELDGKHVRRLAFDVVLPG